MLDQVVVIYCICQEITKILNIQDDGQCKMSSAEVMTFAILSSYIYGGNYRKTRLVSLAHRYFPNLLSHSQLVRRIHQIPEQVWYTVFLALQVILRNKNCKEFIVDSFPVKAYENHKSFRAKIFSRKEFHGYTASKKVYFFGIKVHMIIDTNGVPIEFLFSSGSASDIKTLQEFSLNLPQDSFLFGDAAYTSYEFEEILKELDSIHLVPKRCKNHKKQHSKEREFLLSKQRNYIETVFSSIVSRMPRYIKARTERGFCLKVLFFILAYMVNLYFPMV